MEARAMAYINKIDEMGGIVHSIEEGYPQRELANSAYQFQRAVDSGERVIIGINITNPGSGYTSAPNVTINAVGGGAGGTERAERAKDLVWTCKILRCAHDDSVRYSRARDSAPSR